MNAGRESTEIPVGEPPSPRCACVTSPSSPTFYPDIFHLRAMNLALIPFKTSATSLTCVRALTQPVSEDQGMRKREEPGGGVWGLGIRNCRVEDMIFVHQNTAWK